MSGTYLVHISTDGEPVVYKYPHLSPWSHCAANPLNIVDWIGRDIFSLQSDGTMNYMGQLPVTDIVIARNNDFLFLKSGTIADVQTGIYNGKDRSMEYSYYKFDNNGFNEFRFFAEHTDVEWDSILLDDGTSIVGTSNKYDAVANGAAFFPITRVRDNQTNNSNI